MKIICTQENLKAGLQATSRIITSSNTLPILNNLLLKTENGLLKISSTNLEVSIHTLVRCKVEIVGEVCVPAKTFTELVNTLPNKNITLTKKDGVLGVSVEKHSVNVKTLPSEDFPSIPTVEGENGLHFKPAELKETLEKVLFAASLNETQPEICGLFIQGFGTGAKFVATDRYRLAEKKVVFPMSQFTKGLILPLKTTHELIKALNTTTEEVTILVGENQILFTIADTQIISRLIEGQYPDYEQIIPKEFATVATVERQALIGAFRTSSIFSQGSNSIRLKVDSTSNQVVVFSDSQDLGESVVELVANITGPSVEVLFNYRYVLDMLNNTTSDEIVIKVNSDNLPVVFSENNNPNYLYLVMPIKN